MGFNFLSQRVTNVALPDPQKKQSVAKYDDLPRKKHITDRCAFVTGHIWREQSCQGRFCKWWASALHNFQSKSIEILDSGHTINPITAGIELVRYKSASSPCNSCFCVGRSMVGWSEWGVVSMTAEATSKSILRGLIGCRHDLVYVVRLRIWGRVGKGEGRDGFLRTSTTKTPTTHK